jgi:spore photoproduct lyase
MGYKFSKINRITNIRKKTTVVNFSVNKNENYFANGILTHNCYMKRHKPEGLDVATNTNDILTAINNHAFFATVDKPNQTDPEYVTYDIACNEDFALHAKHHEWEKIFTFFRDHPVAKATLATKIVPDRFLIFDPKGKVRIRFSLMPQKISSILEPETASIEDRLRAVDRFIAAGYDIHLNFSPVIYYDGWEDDYVELFHLVDEFVDNKECVKAEVIFLTHNENKHIYNMNHGLPGEDILWTPDVQEAKTSEYGGMNIRYKSDLKSDMIAVFKDLHEYVIPWNQIRYIF